MAKETMESVIAKAEYVPVGEIKKVFLKSGKVFETSGDDAKEIMSGLYVGKGKLYSDIDEKQLSLFAKGGRVKKMPESAKYITRYEIEKVELDSGRQIDATKLYNGLWFNDWRTMKKLKDYKKRTKTSDSKSKATSKSKSMIPKEVGGVPTRPFMMVGGGVLVGALLGLLTKK